MLISKLLHVGNSLKRYLFADEKYKEKMEIKLFEPGGEPSVSALAGKHSSIAVCLANKAMHEGGVHTWKTEYGV